MVPEPRVNHVPVITGGNGHAQIRHFYATHFIPCQPPDVTQTFVCRTVSDNRLVDELIYSFTHTIDMPWMLPGIPPTGKHVEVPIIVVVEFTGDRIAQERIYWDQASVLVQLGLLDPATLPIWGSEVARKMLDASQKSNVLIEERSAK
jgi:carboxymethylenebutenolidase